MKIKTAVVGFGALIGCLGFSARAQILPPYGDTERYTQVPPNSSLHEVGSLNADCSFTPDPAYTEVSLITQQGYAELAPINGRPIMAALYFNTLQANGLLPSKWIRSQATYPFSGADWVIVGMSGLCDPNQPPAGQANLAPAQPSTWSDKIVVTTMQGSRVDSPLIYDDQSLFVNWAVMNQSTSVNVLSSFACTLLLDNVRVKEWNLSGLSAGRLFSVTDFALGKLSGGPHTITLQADSGGAVQESNKQDNSYTKTLTINYRNPPVTNTFPGLTASYKEMVSQLVTLTGPARLQLATSGGWGVLNMYVAAGYDPTPPVTLGNFVISPGVFDYAAEGAGTAKSIVITNAPAGTYHVLLYAPGDGLGNGFNDVTLIAQIFYGTNQNNNPPATSFSDDFNRADANDIGNGWLNTSGNEGGNLVIRNGAVTCTAARGAAGLYRLYPFTAPLTISATVSEKNGSIGLLRQYGNLLSINSDGTAWGGYGIRLYRADQNYADSRVELWDNHKNLGQNIDSTFQFGQKVHVALSFTPDGKIDGAITGDGQTFTFSYGPRTIQSSGQNFSWTTEFPDPVSPSYTFPTLDDISIGGGLAPTITVNPQSQTVRVEGSVFFSVAAQGATPLLYDWRFNGRSLPGASRPILSLTDIQFSNAGAYSVVVSNSYGSATSAVARLVVYLVPPTGQPPPPSASPGTAPAPGLVTPGTVPTSKQLIIFTGNAVDTNQMTIVLTHGWISSILSFPPDGIDGWPTNMQNILKTNGAPANIVGWNWRDEATSFSPASAASRTITQGDALGAALVGVLGANYNRPIHFLGHSLGALVNCEAADYLHGDAIDSPGNLTGFRPENTHLTMLDEAEMVSVLDADHLRFDPTLSAEMTSFFIENRWLRVIPKHYGWIDNYISQFGLLHAEAANVLLWRDWSFNPFGPHEYAHSWYSLSVRNPLESLMGYRWSFERDTFKSIARPAANSYFTQSLLPLDGELTLTDISKTTAAALAAENYGAFLNEFVAYPTMAAFELGTAAGSMYLDQVQNSSDFLARTIEALIPKYLDGVEYSGAYLGQTIEAFLPSSSAESSGQPVFLGTANSTPAYFLPPGDTSAPAQAIWDMQFSVQPSLLPQVQLQGASARSTITPQSLYVSVPLVVPRTAQSLTLQLQLTHAGAGEDVTVGMGDQKQFTLESKFIPDGVWFPIHIPGIANYAGQQTKVFVAINAIGKQPQARLDVRSIRFNGPRPPTLTATTAGSSLVVTWPEANSDYICEQSQDLKAWVTVPANPGLVDFRFNLTNNIVGEHRYFRLRHK